MAGISSARPADGEALKERTSARERKEKDKKGNHGENEEKGSRTKVVKDGILPEDKKISDKDDR